jgi:hypothetical protein
MAPNLESDAFPVAAFGGRNVWRSAVAVPTRNDATTRHRFAVTRWRSEVNSNCPAASRCEFTDFVNFFASGLDYLGRVA